MGILWHQGERDAQDDRDATTYSQRLAAMIDDLRRDLNAPDVPFVAGKLGEFSPDTRNNKPYHWRTVNEQLASLPALVRRAAVVESKGLSHQGDTVHFDTPSLRAFGVTYADAMRKLQANPAVLPQLERNPGKEHTVR